MRSLRFAFNSEFIRAFLSLKKSDRKCLDLLSGETTTRHLTTPINFYGYTKPFNNTSANQTRKVCIFLFQLASPIQFSNLKITSKSLKVSIFCCLLAVMIFTAATLFMDENYIANNAPSMPSFTLSKNDCPQPSSLDVDSVNLDQNVDIKEQVLNPYFKYHPIILPEKADFLISQVDMKVICDYHFGHYDHPEHNFTKFTDITPSSTLYDGELLEFPKLFNGVAIFVDSPFLDYFTYFILPNIKVNFTLVSGDSDLSNPGFLEEKVHSFKVLDPVTGEAVNIERMLHSDMLIKNPYLLHWWGMNCNRNPDPSKFSCLPLGISQHFNERDTLAEFVKKGYSILWKSPEIQKLKANNNDLVVVSFSLDRTERIQVHGHFCDEFVNDGIDNPLRRVTKCKTNFVVSDQSDFYHTMGTTKFVVSPHGHGLDCYRTYSALYLGAYPIVKTSSLDEQYEGLPVLIVQEWTDVTVELLQLTAKEFDSKIFDYSKLFKGYWFDKFRSYNS